MDPSELRALNPEGFARKDRAAALGERIATLAANIHAASFRLIEMLGEFDALHGWEGWPSPAHWLQWRCGFSLNAAREKFRVARALPELPKIREAFERGALSVAQVRAMTRVATPENEATVLMWAQYSTASHMERLARLYRRYGESVAALDQHRERSFSHWEEDNGMVSIRIRLPAEQAAVVLQAIVAAKATLDGRDREENLRESMVARERGEHGTPGRRYRGNAAARSPALADVSGRGRYCGIAARPVGRRLRAGRRGVPGAGWQATGPGREVPGARAPRIEEGGHGSRGGSRRAGVGRGDAQAAGLRGGAGAGDP